jgi:hypothetical protein
MSEASDSPWFAKLSSIAILRTFKDNGVGILNGAINVTLK